MSFHCKLALMASAISSNRGMVADADRLKHPRGGKMLANRSIPRCTVIPELAYPEIGEAIDWLCDAFGFSLRLRIGNHRAQLNVGDGAVVLTEQRGLDGEDSSSAAEVQPRRVDRQHSVMVRVENVDRHRERAEQRGARVLRQPADYPYGERQYTAQDLVGRCWTFSQSIADVAPEEWGGTRGQI
jgi:uncharacterized glyoxalase superfamily protein PhnB